jgi:hypothetical protein
VPQALTCARVLLCSSLQHRTSFGFSAPTAAPIAHRPEGNFGFVDCTIVAPAAASSSEQLVPSVLPQYVARSGGKRARARVRTPLAHRCSHASSLVCATVLCVRNPAQVTDLLSAVVGSTSLLRVLRSSPLNPLRIDPAQIQQFAALYPQTEYTLRTDAVEYDCPHTALLMKLPIGRQALPSTATKIRDLHAKIEHANGRIAHFMRDREESIQKLVQEYIAHSVLLSVSLSIQNEDIAGRNRTVDRKRMRDEIAEEGKRRLRQWDEEAHARNGNARVPLARTISPAAACDSVEQREGDEEEEDEIDAALENDDECDADNNFINDECEEDPSNDRDD